LLPGLAGNECDANYNGGIMDFIKKMTLASIGAVTMTREKAEELFDELVKKGEMTNDERAEAIKTFVEKSSESAEKVKKLAEETYEKVSSQFASKFNEQIGTLAQKIEQLNLRLSELEAKINKTP
jgi:poly(hydroxyalkanoate) granule-associated protein